MPKCKNDSSHHYRGTEFSPKGKGYCAAGEDVGTEMIGRNGEMWTVISNRHGTKRWIPFYQKRSELIKRPNPTQDPKSRKKTKKEKKSSKDEEINDDEETIEISDNEETIEISDNDDQCQVVNDYNVVVTGGSLDSDDESEEKVFIYDSLLEMGEVINLMWVSSEQKSWAKSVGGVYQITDFNQGRYYIRRASCRGRQPGKEWPCPEGAWFTPLSEYQKEAYIEPTVSRCHLKTEDNVV